VHARSSLRRLLPGLVLLIALIAAACGSSDSSKGSAVSTLRLGYFPNVTHATAIVGVDKGIFTKNLGTTKLDTKLFNAGPEAVEALFAGALDASYVGPNPAINAYQKSHGEAIRIISGATSGGAFLVVKSSINSPSDLKGKSLATPQLGQTQDVALRSWLKSKGLATDTSGGGDVSIKPQANADALTAFKQGQIDGGWEPEPWATRMVQEGGGKILVDERDLWPGGRFVTTQLIVRTAFLKDHPDVVKRLVEGQVEANDFVNKNGAESRTIVTNGIAKLTGKPLPQKVVDAAWQNLTFTNDPIASSLAKSAKAAEEVGLLKPVNLKGIYDLSFLNEVLKSKAEQQVKGL
jgi:sulfonate transport system substrate-binding protein